MPETNPAPVMEEKAVANGAAALETDSTKEVAAETESKDAEVADKNAQGQNKVSENGTEGPKDGEVKMAEAENAKEGDGNAGAAEQLDSGDVKNDADAKEDNSSKPAEGEDVKMAEAESAKEGDGNAGAAEQLDSGDVKNDADAKEDNSSKPAEGEDVKMAEPGKESQGEADEVKQMVSEDLKDESDDGAKPAEAEDVQMAEAEKIDVKDEGQAEDKDENKNVDEKDELEEKGKSCSADLKEEEAEEKDSSDKKEEGPGYEKTDANEKKANKDGADNHGKDSEVTEEQVSEADKVEEENKEETPKNKKARSARDRSQGKDKKQEGIKSREAKSLLNTPSLYGTDRPQRERKTVERLVEAIEEPNMNFVIEKGRGTPLKDIPGVAHRISRKKPADLKFLHSILFGRKGKAVDFKGHILQFSGFVWHESDEKMRAKAKEKLDKCVKDELLDLCWLFTIPVAQTNLRKEDIVTKLLDFIAEPHGVADSGLSDEQGSHSRKRKRGGSSSKTPDSTTKKFGDSSAKRPKKALELNSDEDEDDYEPMKSDSEENKIEDSDVETDEREDHYESGKEKAGKISSKVKESSGRKKTDRGSGHKTGTARTISKSPIRKSSSKISKEQESPDDSTKVFSRKGKPSSKGAFVEKETKEKKSSGKKVMKGKGASAEANLPSKEELRKTIIGILKKVDFNTATFSDILKKLDNHYKMDLAPKKEAIKVMIQDELTKLSEETDEDEGGGQDVGKKQKHHTTKEVEA